MSCKMPVVRAAATRVRALCQNLPKKTGALVTGVTLAAVAGCGGSSAPSGSGWPVGELEKRAADFSACGVVFERPVAQPLTDKVGGQSVNLGAIATQASDAAARVALDALVRANSACLVPKFNAHGAGADGPTAELWKGLILQADLPTQQADQRTFDLRVETALRGQTPIGDAFARVDALNALAIPLANTQTLLATVSAEAGRAACDERIVLDSAHGRPVYLGPQCVFNELQLASAPTWTQTVLVHDQLGTPVGYINPDLPGALAINHDRLARNAGVDAGAVIPKLIAGLTRNGVPGFVDSVTGALADTTSPLELDTLGAAADQTSTAVGAAANSAHGTAVANNAAAVAATVAAVEQVRGDYLPRLERV